MSPKPNTWACSLKQSEFGTLKSMCSRFVLNQNVPVLENPSAIHEQKLRILEMIFDSYFVTKLQKLVAQWCSKDSNDVLTDNHSQIKLLTLINCNSVNSCPNSMKIISERRSVEGLSIYTLKGPNANA